MHAGSGPAADVEGLKSALEKLKAGDQRICALLPDEAIEPARQILSGSDKGEVTLDTVAALLAGLPNLVDPSAGVSTVNIDVSTFFKVVSAVCFLEEAWEAGQAAEAVDPLFEQILFQMIFWKASLANDMLLTAALSAHRPDLVGDAATMGKGSALLDRMVEVAHARYAAAVLRRAGALATDTMLLRRVLRYLDISVRPEEARLAAALVFAASGDGNDCLAAANKALRALDVKGARTVLQQCARILDKDRYEQASANFKKMEGAARQARDTARRTDVEGRILHGNALLDVGRQVEGERVLNALRDAGEQDSRIATPLALGHLRRGDYSASVDTLAALADDKWDRNAANALATAATMVLVREVLIAANSDGSKGIVALLDAKAFWLAAVIAQVERFDPAVADYMAILRDGVKALLSEEGASRWSKAGVATRERLEQHRKKLGTDANWGRIGILAALFANRDKESAALLSGAVAALDEDDDLVASGLSLNVLVELFSSGTVSDGTAKRVKAFTRNTDPQALLAAAQYAAARAKKDGKGMASAAALLGSTVEGMRPSSHRVAAMNNLAVALADGGDLEAATKVLDAAASVALDDNDRLLSQINGLAVLHKAGSLPPGAIDFLMSVASADQPSDVVRMVASRLLLKNRKLVPGLKIGAVEQVLTESEQHLSERGFYAPEMNAAVMANVNFSPMASEEIGGKVSATFGVTADVTLFLWYSPEEAR
jgi:hypothetical protein